MRCVKCKQIYDILCANFTESVFATLSPEFKNTWICVECRSKFPKTDNSQTPVRHPNVHDMSISSDCPDISMSSPDRVTVRTGARHGQAEKQNDNLKSLLDCMQATFLKELKKAQVEHEMQLTAKITAIVTEQFSTLKSQLLDKIDDLTAKVTDLEKKINTMGAPCSKPDIREVREILKDSIPNSKSSHPNIKQTVTSKRNPAAEQNGRKNTVVTNGTPTRNIPGSQKTQSAFSEITHPNKEEEERDWIEVRRKRTRSSLSGVLRGTAVPGTTSLCAAERWKYLHLYYVQEGTSEEQVRDHLQSICGSDTCTVETLKSRGRYASFKLGVTARNAENVMSSKNWAEGICVKPWRQNFRAKESKKPDE